MTINWPYLAGTLFPAGPPGTPGVAGPIGPAGIGITGPTGPSPWSAPTQWAPSTSYTPGPPASLAIYAGNPYVCIVPHTSTASFNAAYWQQVLGVRQQNLQSPATGFNITANQGDTDLILDPAGTLASGTVTMQLNPNDGQGIKIYTSQTITSFTIAGNGKTVKGAPTTFAGTTSNYEGIYHAANNTWYF